MPGDRLRVPHAGWHFILTAAQGKGWCYHPIWWTPQNRCRVRPEPGLLLAHFVSQSRTQRLHIMGFPSGREGGCRGDRGQKWITHTPGAEEWELPTARGPLPGSPLERIQ